MTFDWLIPILMFIILLGFIMGMIAAVFAMTGINPSSIIFAWRATRRVRTEEEPRDHYDRWVHSHRRSARDNKPPMLRFIWSTGDSDVPRRYHGRVKGIEAWRSYFIVYVKSRRWSWSVPYLISQSRCSDVNRRNLWVRSRGFTTAGPIRIPLPVEGERDLEGHVLAHLKGFRMSFETQLHQDIQEDMAWDIANAMAPPLADRTRAAQVQQPSFTDREFMSEETATGGSQ